jgi:lysophospholipase L1-like esterase
LPERSLRSKIKKSWLVALRVCIFTLVTAHGAGVHGEVRKTGPDDPTRYKTDIERFERLDRSSSPKPGGILFVGSSSIRMWRTLKSDMAPLPVINRGFGGAKIPDVIHYAHRIVLPYRPRMIVFYAGDNDMSLGRIHSPRRVLQSFKRFRKLVHRALPKTRIYFLSITPSGRRWKHWPRMSAANRLLRRYCRSVRLLTYVDVGRALLGPGNKPRQGVFEEDRLHLNARGYALWTAIIKPIIQRDFRK